MISKFLERSSCVVSGNKKIKEEEFVKTVLKKAASLCLSATILATSYINLLPSSVTQAQQVAGNAPFINTWLVSGPFDEAAADEIYQISAPEERENLALKAHAEANSVFHNTDEDLVTFAGSKAIDGSKSTEWVSYFPDGILPKQLTLTWDDPITVQEIAAYDRKSTDPGDNTTSILCELYNAQDELIISGETTDPTFDQVGNVVFDTPQNNVSKIVLTMQKNNGSFLNPGIPEVMVYAEKEAGAIPEDPDTEINPVLGENFGTETEELLWEYFDDRLWNRSYDDYNDLYGYYDIKQNIPTQNQYLYAHTYVYSPTEQNAQVRVGASGSYSVFVNDVQVQGATEPVLVQKDLTVKDITLKKGWNKLLIQINHTFTDDVYRDHNKMDNNVIYAGFYGRITDSNGNEIEGLQYSVSGNVKENAPLQIDTGALKANQDDDDNLPEGNMPTGYTEWPYVWNVSTANNSYGVHATAFQLMASGGKPGYSWKITEGSLPEGVTLNLDGTFDGYVDDDPGDYPFTVQVTDSEGNTADKQLSIHVKERPNKLFEEGRVSALSHAIGVYPSLVDPNFSADLWAQRAKAEGHSYHFRYG